MERKIDILTIRMYYPMSEKEKKAIDEVLKVFDNKKYEIVDCGVKKTIYIKTEE